MLKLVDPDPIYDIHLPLTYNNGNVIEEEKFTITRDELVTRFGGMTSTPPGFPLLGYWYSPQGVVVEDNIVVWRIVTPVDDDIFFNEYQQRLKKRFIQDTIFILKTQGEAL